VYDNGAGVGVVLIEVGCGVTTKDCCVTDQRNVLGTFLSFLFRTGVRPSSNTPTHLAARVEVLDASLFWSVLVFVFLISVMSWSAADEQPRLMVIAGSPSARRWR
jgi:hypothetical protein